MDIYHHAVCLHIIYARIERLPWSRITQLGFTPEIKKKIPSTHQYIRCILHEYQSIWKGLRRPKSGGLPNRTHWQFRIVGILNKHQHNKTKHIAIQRDATQHNTQRPCKIYLHIWTPLKIFDMHAVQKLNQKSIYIVLNWHFQFQFDLVKLRCWMRSVSITNLICNVS